MTEAKTTCDICGKTYMPSSFPIHVRSCLAKKEKKKIVIIDDAPRQKRNSALK